MTNKQIKIDGLTITISEKNPDNSFSAWFGDYDLDCMVGWGMTEISACADLLDKHNDYLQTRLAARFNR